MEERLVLMLLERQLKPYTDPVQARVDAETIIGFWRFFEFDQEEIQAVFPYPRAVFAPLWEIVQGLPTIRQFDEGEGGLGVPAPGVPPSGPLEGESACEIPEREQRFGR